MVSVRLLSWVPIVAIAGAAAAAAQGDPPQGRPNQAPGALFGRVVDRDTGTPMRFAAVQLVRLRPSSVAISTTAAEDGTFACQIFSPASTSRRPRLRHTRRRPIPPGQRRPSSPEARLRLALVSRSVHLRFGSSGVASSRERSSTPTANPRRACRFESRRGRRLLIPPAPCSLSDSGSHIRTPIRTRRVRFARSVCHRASILFPQVPGTRSFRTIRHRAGSEGPSECTFLARPILRRPCRSRSAAIRSD